MLRTSSPRSLPQPGHRYDVAVVGAGLAGCELAWRLARAHFDVLLVTQSLDSVGNLFHARVPHAFPDGTLFEQARRAAAPDDTNWALHREVKRALESTSGIHLLQSCVTKLEGASPHALHTWEGPTLTANVVVLAVGSFLRGRLTVGEFDDEAGRLSEIAYDFLYDDLVAAGVAFEARRDAWRGEDGSVPYTVAYETLAPNELAGFACTRFEQVYAVGRCRPGDASYESVLAEAADLAARLGASEVSA